MPNRTKEDLEAALKRMMLKKPLNKITINDLAEEAGISRMTFYYHFKDIYDLVEWSCVEDATRALEGKKTYDTWVEGLTQIFEAVHENKPFIMNVYRYTERERIENFLYSVVSKLIEGVVVEQSASMDISEEERAFIAKFYMYSFVGIMLEWIGHDMRDDYEKIVCDVATVMKGNISNSIRNFCSEGKQ